MSKRATDVTVDTGLREATNWVAEQNGWDAIRYLMVGGEWYVQTADGGYSGKELINVYEREIDRAVRREKRKGRIATAVGFIVGLIFFGGGEIIFKVF